MERTPPRSSSEQDAHISFDWEALDGFEEQVLGPQRDAVSSTSTKSQPRISVPSMRDERNTMQQRVPYERRYDYPYRAAEPRPKSPTDVDVDVHSGNDESRGPMFLPLEWIMGGIEYHSDNDENMDKEKEIKREENGEAEDQVVHSSSRTGDD